MRKKLPLALLCAAIVSTPALAKPPAFVDDLVTTATYDRNSLIESCTTGVAAKWMIYSLFDGQISYEQLIVADGRMVLNASKYMNASFTVDGGTLIGRVEAITAGWHGLGLSGAAGFPAICLNEPPPGGTDSPFTDDEICTYAGYSFNAFELTARLASDDGYGLQFGPDLAPGIKGVDDDGNGLTDDDANCGRGPDGQPGQAGVDDDGNGITDDIIEAYWCACGFDVPDQCLGINDDVLAPGGINQANMRRAGEYLAFGLDSCPGACGVDDDGNGVTDWLLSAVPDYAGYDDDQDGTTDEVGERQPDLGDFGFGDDSDDFSGEVLSLYCIRADVGLITGACLEVDTSFDAGQFQIQDVFIATLNDIGGTNDEMGPDFYQAGVHYSYAFCASGSCYGAQLWFGDDIANPIETVGPAIDTNHLNKASDREYGAIFIQVNSALFTPFSDKRLLGNKYLGNRFWIVQGPPGEESLIVASDRDGDFDVDGVDFSVFASCFNKAGNPPRTLGCTADDAEAFDADGDGDVDGVDFSRFASCFNKAGNPPRATGCIPILAGACLNCGDITCDAGFHCEIVDGLPTCVVDP